MNGGLPSVREMREANVNPVTGLASDYLNVFNEATMLFELAIDMPALADDLHTWSSRSYVEHFARSGFARRDVVIAAYYAAPADIKARFDGLCEQARATFAEAIADLTGANLACPRACGAARGKLSELKHLTALLDAEIHGRAPCLTEGRLDAGGASDQAAIDALF